MGTKRANQRSNVKTQKKTAPDAQALQTSFPIRPFTTVKRVFKNVDLGSFGAGITGIGRGLEHQEIASSILGGGSLGETPKSPISG
jgi:hypothetical protein